LFTTKKLEDHFRRVKEHCREVQCITEAFYWLLVKVLHPTRPKICHFGNALPTNLLTSTEKTISKPGEHPQKYTINLG